MRVETIVRNAANVPPPPATRRRNSMKAFRGSLRKFPLRTLRSLRQNKKRYIFQPQRTQRYAKNFSRLACFSGTGLATSSCAATRNPRAPKCIFAASRISGRRAWSHFSRHSLNSGVRPLSKKEIAHGRLPLAVKLAYHGAYHVPAQSPWRFGMWSPYVEEIML